MTKIIDGKHIANELTGVLSEQVTALKAQDIVPKLVNVGINPDERALMYIRLKGRLAEEIGVEYQYLDWSGRSQEDCLAQMARLASDSDVHGIIVQIPLPDKSQTDEVLNAVAPKKDADALGKNAVYDPATPMAINWLLAGYNIDLRGKNIVIVGHGRLVGKPLAKMWQAWETMRR